MSIFDSVKSSYKSGKKWQLKKISFAKIKFMKSELLDGRDSDFALVNLV